MAKKAKSPKKTMKSGGGSIVGGPAKALSAK